MSPPKSRRLSGGEGEKHISGKAECDSNLSPPREKTPECTLKTEQRRKCKAKQEVNKKEPKRVNLHLRRVKNENTGQATKSTRGMPWHQEPTKDAAISDMPRGAESRHRSVDFRMGKPGCGSAVTVR